MLHVQPLTAPGCRLLQSVYCQGRTSQNSDLQRILLYYHWPNVLCEVGTDFSLTYNINNLAKVKLSLCKLLRRIEGVQLRLQSFFTWKGCLIYDMVVNGGNNLQHMSDHQCVKDYNADNYVRAWQTRSRINNNSSAATALWTVVTQEFTVSSGRTCPDFTGLNTATFSSKSVLHAIYLNS